MEREGERRRESEDKKRQRKGTRLTRVSFVREKGNERYGRRERESEIETKRERERERWKHRETLKDNEIDGTRKR